MTNRQPLPLDLDELLAAEYDYIAQTAAQAHEDRARVSSFYLIAVGSLLAALFGTQLFDPAFLTQTVNLMFSGLFVMLTLLGTSTILQLARLRAAWFESAMAMNQLKDFMISQNSDLQSAFRWNPSTLPDKFKTNSVSYYQAFEVSLIGGIMAGAAIFFLLQAFLQISILTWLLAGLTGVTVFVLQLRLYQRALH